MNDLRQERKRGPPLQREIHHHHSSFPHPRRKQISFDFIFISRNLPSLLLRPSLLPVHEEERKGGTVVAVAVAVVVVLSRPGRRPTRKYDVPRPLEFLNESRRRRRRRRRGYVEALRATVNLCQRGEGVESISSRTSAMNSISHREIFLRESRRFEGAEMTERGKG